MTLYPQIIIDALATVTYAGTKKNLIDTSLMTFCDGMSRQVKVGLGGECADEVFGGYPWFHREELKNSDFFPWIRSINERCEYINKEIIK